MMQLLADGNSPPPPIDADPSRGGAGLEGTRTCGDRGAEAVRDPSGSRLASGGGPTAPLPSLGRTARNEERRVPPHRCKRHRERVP